MIEFRSLRREELDAWADHCVYVFNDGRSNPVLKKLFIDHVYNDPDSDLNGILVALDDGKIVSTVKVIYRNAYFFDREVKVGGICEVSTRPEYQGRGLAGRLLDMAIEQMRNKHVQLSMLRGTLSLYDKLGWFRATTYTKVVQVEARNSENYRIRPANIQDETPALKALYQQFSRKFHGAFVRNDDEYWKLWVKTEGGNIWVVENGQHEIIGYVSFKYDGGSLLIHEFCTSPPYENLFDDVAGELCFVMGLDQVEVRFESLIPSNMKVGRVEQANHNMFRLLCPIQANSSSIESTEQMMSVLRQISASYSEPVSDVLAWNIDGF